MTIMAPSTLQIGSKSVEKNAGFGVRKFGFKPGLCHSLPLQANSVVGSSAMK